MYQEFRLGSDLQHRDKYQVVEGTFLYTSQQSSMTRSTRSPNYWSPGSTPSFLESWKHWI